MEEKLIRDSQTLEVVRRLVISVKHNGMCFVDRNILEVILGINGEQKDNAEVSSNDTV